MTGLDELIYAMTGTYEPCEDVDALMSDAAEEIERLRTSRDGLGEANHRLSGGCSCRFDDDNNPIAVCGLHAEQAEEIERLREAHERMADRLDIRQDEDGTIYDEIDRLTAALQNTELDLEQARGPDAAWTLVDLQRAVLDNGIRARHARAALTERSKS